jgi:hypothetical protein
VYAVVQVKTDRTSDKRSAMLTKRTKERPVVKSSVRRSCQQRRNSFSAAGTAPTPENPLYSMLVKATAYTADQLLCNRLTLQHAEIRRGGKIYASVRY